ncbi:MAG: hypothetical protein KAQ92_02785, partial [Candidatus Aenigmarchaeota archaeon]|nr:hypothetical protein [Candidatus Aenigmarchaeota archaeon]
HIYAMAVNIATIVITLSFLKINTAEDIVIQAYNFLPFILSTILLAILIFFLVRFIFYLIQIFLTTSGMKNIIEEYISEQDMNIFLFILKYILYIVFGLVALTTLGIDISSAIVLFKTIIYPILILGLIFLFVGLKPYVENVFSGLFLKRMNFLRVGEQIKIKKETYSIDTLKAQGVILIKKGNIKAFMPYKKLYESELKYKEIMYDLSTLEKIKNHFLAQSASFCGPASASIILKIFGYNITQEEIGNLSRTAVPVQKKLDGTKLPGGTTPKQLINSVEELTKNKVKGVWININKINDLKLELKTWLNNKALIIIDYKKSFLFPEAKKAHYSVCFSIRGEEMLILDPGLKKGGVYFADIKKVYNGMNTYSELLKGKRGYIVFAPKGTTAYQRIEEGLIYSDPDLYKDLSNNLTKELNALIKRAGKFENILPKSIKKAIDEYKKKEKVTRVWRPKSKQ